MKMTFDQYYDNPMGKNNAVLPVSARNSIKDSYIKKWGVIMLRENGNVNHFFYHDKKHNAYYAHFKIPSETVKSFYYDVVIKFTADASVGEAGSNLFKYAVQFYSNDPAFVYNYAYVFNKNDMFITALSNKMSKEALRKAPKEKNPSLSIGYVKTIIFAYLYMKSKGLNNTKKFAESAASYSIGHLSGNIEEADTKIRNRQEKNPEREVKERKRNEIPEKVKEKVSIGKGIKSTLGNVHVIKPGTHSKLGNVNTITPKAKINNNGIGHFKKK